MKKWGKLMAGLLLGALVLLPAQASAAGWELPDSGTPGLQKAFYLAGLSDEEWEVLALTNKERIAAGVDPVTTFAGMQNAAGVRAKELATLYSHTRPDGSRWVTALREAGVSYNGGAENIAMMQLTPESVMESWMNSQGHMENILRDSYRHMGAGHYKEQYRNHWVQLFAGGCSFRSLKILEAEDLTVRKGTSLESLGIVCQLNCEHGSSYLPLDVSFCSGYNAQDTTGKPQTVTVRVCGKTADFQITVGGKADDAEDKPSAKPGKTALRITERTATTLNVEWDCVSGAEGYTVWYRSEYEDSVSRKVFNGAGKNYWNLSGLQPGTKYFFTVRAWVDNGSGREHDYLFGDASDVQRGTTKPMPAIIKNAEMKDGKIKIWLKGPAQGAEMYSMCYAGSPWGFENGYFEVGIRTRYTTRTLDPVFREDEIYCLRVKSYRDLGNNKRVYGEWSNDFYIVYGNSQSG